MSEGVLYFPYISVPQNAWFARVLLYWDQVGSIVPERHARDLSRVSTFMRDLVRADLVHPIVPEAFDSRLGRALSPFLDFVDSDPEIAARAEAGFGPQVATRGGMEPGTSMQIHRGKFGHVIGNELVRRGLARPARRRDWLEVESRTASAFMAYLAATLGSFREVGMNPITDTVASLSPYARAGAGASPLEIADDLRLGVLEAVLPGPDNEISVTDLVDFKERHGELLARFRRHVESRLLDLAVIEDAELRKARRGLLTDELREELDDVQARMRPRWPKIVFGTLCGLAQAVIPVGMAAATGALPLAAAGLPGLMGAVYSAQGAVRAPDDARQHPLAYAALARKKLAGTG